MSCEHSHKYCQDDPSNHKAVSPRSLTENDNSSSDSARELVSMPSQQMITEQSRIQPLRKAAMRAHKKFS